MASDGKKKRAREEEDVKQVKEKKVKKERKEKKEKKEKKERKEKKEKKAKVPKEQAAPLTTATQAVVGDAQLAKTAKAIVKDLYKEHKRVAAQSAAEVRAAYERLGLTVENSDARPVEEFALAGFDADVLKSCATFKQPSPIQAISWPVLLGGRDLVGIAATGSGKTLAFGLPMIQHIRAQKAAGVVKGKRPASLTLSPTRELAMQIAEVLDGAGRPCGMSVLCVYGGVPKVPQQKSLRSGIDILVGTPGRLRDLIEDGSADLGQVTYLVLDEADRMLDLGFKPEIEAICSNVRADRQTAMFSATWPMQIQQLANDFLARPAKAVVGSQDLAASHSVKQIVEVIDPSDRPQRLLALLETYHGKKGRKNRVMVFVLYKKEASRVEQFLNSKGWKAAAVHGDASQAERTRAVESFKSGSVPLLIATDVAARGLDIPDVEVVLNYSFPLTIEDYVHRIGRTGRAGKSGVSHTFFSGQTDKPRAGELVNVLREAGMEVPSDLLKFGTHVKKKESKLYGAHFKEVDMTKKATKVTFDSDDDD
ncbi:unnamed protein product [Pedinophyceae sp. YPF-701]|nr:unnamed protein product [Pedinophyceae sp. YPF-701]